MVSTRRIGTVTVGKSVRIPFSNYEKFVSSALEHDLNQLRVFCQDWRLRSRRVLLWGTTGSI